MKMPSQTTRAYFYRVAAAVLAGLVLAGVITGDDLPVWLNIVAAVLGISAPTLAAFNTSTTPPLPPLPPTDDSI